MARPTILVVEDRELALLLRRILRASGYRVLICRSGSQALRICSRLSLRIDLVLTTLQLPDIDGEAMVLILERVYPHLKIMGLSLYQSRANRFADLGISFIEKPFNNTELVARIHKVLGRGTLSGQTDATPDHDP